MIWLVADQLSNAEALVKIAGIAGFCFIIWVIFR